MASCVRASVGTGQVRQEGYDVIVVRGFDKGLGALSCTEFFVQFSNNTSMFRGMFKREPSTNSSADTLDEEESGRESFSSFVRMSSGSRPKPVVVRCNGQLCESQVIPAFVVNDRLMFVGVDGEYTTTPPSRVLEQLDLCWGKNSIIFECPDYRCEVACSVWLWSVADRMVVVDVDGTLTRSDVRGYVETVYLGMYDYVHSGVADFLNSIVRQGTMMTEFDNIHDAISQQDSDDQFRAVSHLRVVYLTARPLRHLQETKRFIAGVSEREQLLPAGPLFCNKVGQLQALYGEMLGTTAEFKGQLLLDIEHQFIRVGRGGESPWVIGIGNKDTDAQAYQMCNIRPENIFIVQKSSEIHCHVQQARQSEEFISDDEVSSLLRNHHDCQPVDTLPRPVGMAIVENTLDAFTNCHSSHRNGRRHGVDVNEMRGLRPALLPGDNGGLLIEGYEEAEQWPLVANDGSCSTYPIGLHIFSGYDDPMLIQYCNHLLVLHHQAAQSGADLFYPFDFPLPPPSRPDWQSLSARCSGSAGLDASRSRSLSDDDISAEERSTQQSRRSLFNMTSSKWSSGATTTSDLRESTKSGTQLIRRLKLFTSHSSSPKSSKQLNVHDSRTSDMADPLNLPPPTLARVRSEPLPQQYPNLDLAPLSPPPDMPGRARNTKKGAKLSQMTDFYNSEQFADV